MGETTLYIVTLDLTTAAHFAIQLSYPMSYLQHSLQARAGGLFVLVEGVGIRKPTDYSAVFSALD